MIKYKFIMLLLSLLFMLSACNNYKAMEEKLKQEALTLIEETEYETALLKINQAISLRNAGKIDKSKLDLLKYRAEIEFLMADYDKADVSYALLSDIDASTDWYNYMRIICISKGSRNVELAAAIYEKVKDRGGNDPAFEDATFELVSILMNKSRPIEEILHYYQSYIDDESKADARVFNNMGNIYFHYEQYDKALYYYDKGIAYVDTTEDPEGRYYNIRKNILYNKACLYEYMHDYQKALDTFNLYIDIYGPDPNVEHEITFLKSRIR